MGISTAVAALLVRAREQGASFERTATIGRQSLTVPRHELRRLAERVGVRDLDWERFAADGFAEDFFERLLGAKTVTSFDVSEYQQADVAHDLNQPLPAPLHGQFDAVVDGGTMEHVFDVRQVLANYMALVPVGGRLFLSTPANNLFGHGFYQFSAELFYRVFDRANGFALEDVVLVETPFLAVEASAHQRCYRVEDPSRLGRRVKLVNRRPVMIFVQARRVSDEAPFTTSPVQSDYKERKWERGPARAARFEYLTPWQELKRRVKQARKHSLRNREAFRRFDP